MRILCHRIYDAHQPDGYRVLADRLWPRGIRKEEAALDEWCKDLAPSGALRQWFGHDPSRWQEFRRKYRQELEGNEGAAVELLRRAGKKTVVLLYGAKDTEHTHALILKEYLDSLRRGQH